MMTDLNTRRWLTPSLLRGAAFAAAGLVVLLTPHASFKILLYVAGGTLVLSGLSGLWGQRRGRGDIPGALRAFLSLVAGAGLLVVPAGTIRVLWVALAAYVFFLGLLALWRGVGAREAGVSHRIHLARSAFYLTLAALLLVLPGAMLEIMFASLAIGAVLVGLAMVSWSLRHGSEQPLIADRGLASEIVWEWLAEKDMGPERRQVVASGLYFEEPDARSKIASYAVMLLLSVALATLAILQDSTAVIIGAMLVAPLMTPIMGCAAGVVAGWRKRVFVSLAIVALSVVVSVALAWILSAWIPALVPLESNTQVVSRAAPTLVDMAIALAAGAAGAYATIDDRVSSSLTGVAIAVALVPPLGVVGVALEAGHVIQALGAFLLFSTNLVSIVLASVAVFALVGLIPIRKSAEQRIANLDVLSSVAVLALLIMVPLGLTGASVLEDSERTDIASTVVEEWLGADSTLRLLDVDAAPGRVNVELAGSGTVPSVRALEDTLSAALGQPIAVRVELFQSVIIQSEERAPGVAASDSVRVPE